MRKIKFRAWDKEDKVMRMVTSINFTTGIYQAYQNTKGKRVRKAHSMGLSVIMQYIGLHDKTGREIFEGDILSYKNINSIGPSTHWVSYNILISYAEGGFVAKLLSSERDTKETMVLEEPICEYDLTEFIIIGNAYENPELAEPLIRKGEG